MKVPVSLEFYEWLAENFIMREDWNAKTNEVSEAGSRALEIV